MSIDLPLFCRDEPPTLILRGRGQVMAEYMKYFWLMYVHDFDISQHCQPCLLGKKSRKVKASTTQLNQLLVLNEAATWRHLYLCGVSREGYDYNFHMPLAYEPGATAVVEARQGFTAEATHARLLEIPGLPDGYGGYPRSFTTCRNWRFGVHHYTDHDLPVLPIRRRKYS